ncbi:MAG: hypothetical protein ACK4GO_11420 [Gemmobacter sp.]
MPGLSHGFTPEDAPGTALRTTVRARLSELAEVPAAAITVALERLAAPT